ncbi:amidohydrolase [Oceanirhabdus sp. W0125-5]|uniref:amidohydrolase n=1 Tax=Oceanirhabdus sp. W0125-5 TaxID=2999116 RepID=UPI0022F2EA1F|nr:amidohydrolase [Oceanirhabdus sp. W0125-5]WBW97378.1 amidohydrolase [Oceanirhabdus sp. W0125-5]
MKIEKGFNEYLIHLRREFHKYPEVSWKEFETSKRIKEELTKMGLEFKECASTGVVVDIEGNTRGKRVLLRGDIDALELTEKNEFEFKSLNSGVMHACGHDAHIAMLLGAAKLLNDNRELIQGSVRIVFQPAEECGEGAERMISEGVLDGVDSAFAIHIWSMLENGKISVDEGERMASPDIFKVNVKGKGCHGSLPQEGKDALVAAASMVMNLQTVISREISPLESGVVTIGELKSGSKYNIIAEEAMLSGTVRAFNQETRLKIKNSIERIVKSTGDMYGVNTEMEYIFGPPPVVNDKECSKIAEESVKKLFGNESLISMRKLTAGEDFSLFAEKVPSVLAFLGARKEEAYPHHNPRFDIDEDNLEKGAKLYMQYAVDFLGK